MTFLHGAFWITSALTSGLCLFGLQVYILDGTLNLIVPHILCINIPGWDWILGWIFLSSS